MEQVWRGLALTVGATSSDPGVVERARLGDREAFDALVRANADRTFRTALAILGHEADAADAVQDAFVSAWRALGDLRDPSAFDAWLARIALNACRQRLRTRGRDRIRQIAIDPAGRTDPPSGGGLLDDRTADADRFDRAFARLSADERAVLVLHHLDERPVSEIAAALGVPEGTVKSRLHRARAALESALAKESRP